MSATPPIVAVTLRWTDSAVSHLSLSSHDDVSITLKSTAAGHHSTFDKGSACHRVRALQFAQDRLDAGGWTSIRRPLPLTILMWLSAVYAVGAVLGILAVAIGLVSPSMGGMEVTREQWLDVAAPLVAAIAALMVLTSVGLRRHRTWARWCFMLIWPLIIASGVGMASAGAIPWWLGRQAVIEATVAGLFSAWLLFRQRGSVLYFYRIRQARGGMAFRR